jgi:phosphoribosylanthranilate isomerase
VVQVIHVQGPASLDEAVTLAAQVDAILLDSGQPTAPVKELGGTGRTHDWAISRAIRKAVPCPVYLAGGLNPSNVREAVDAVGPYGLDLCSGVRTGGRLDRVKLEAFFSALV